MKIQHRGFVLRKRRALLLFAATAAVSPLVRANPDNWTGTTGLWSAGGNWSEGHVPNAGEDINLNQSDSTTRVVTFDASATSGAGFNSLTVSASGSGSMTLSQTAGLLFVTGTEYLGYNGRGIYSQSGGTNTVNSNLLLGNFSTDIGTYNLSNSGVLNANAVAVGTAGFGLFNQSGGTLNITTGRLTIGDASTANGTFNLSGSGVLNTPTLDVGDSGTGTFIQTGGTANVSGNVYIANASTASGTYTISGGVANIAHLYVGGNATASGGVGVLNVSGGTMTINNIVSVDDIGAVNLSSGTLSTGIIESSGTFSQTGGVNSAGVLELGNERLPGVPSYGLSNGTISSTDTYVGIGGNGVFNQTGGVHTTQTLSLGIQDAAFGNGTYNLSGTGVLMVGSEEDVGNDGGTGIFTQTGGMNTIGTPTAAANLNLGRFQGASGTYTLSGTGLLTVNGNAYLGGSSSGTGGVGVLNISSGTATVTGTLVVDNNSTVNQSGGTLSVTGVEQVGYWSQGTFIQSGGSNIGSSLSLGFYATNSVSKYTLGSGAYLSMQNEYIGHDGSTFGGIFNQTGGSNVTGVLDVGAGSYGLSNGATLSVSALEGVGYFANGVINQTGGLNTTPLLILGSWGNGTFNLSGTGVLMVSSEEDIGYAGGYPGSGSFAQTGGTHTIGTATAAGSLNLGAVAGSSGTYALSGTGLLTVNGNAYVGGSSTGTGGLGVLNVSGGTATITGTLKVYNTVSNAVNLSGGTLSVGNLDTSGNPSRFNWTAGTLNVTGGSGLAFDGGQPLGPSYSIGNGQTLNVSNSEYVGSSGVGVFNQTGGTNSTSSLWLAYNSNGTNPASSGTYTLGGGVLNVSNAEVIGEVGIGVFNQTGGVNTADTIWVGDSRGSFGTYNLSNGATLVVTSNEYVGSGDSGSGTFNQTGGVNSTAALALSSGSFNTNTPGTYNLSGGALNVSGSETIGYNGGGVFTQTGGTNTIGSPATNGALSVGTTGTLATYSISGGSLVVNGNVYVGGSPTGSSGTGQVTVTTSTATVSGTTDIWNDYGVIAIGSGGSFLTNGLINNGFFTQSGGVSSLGQVSGTGVFTIGSKSGGSTARADVTSFSQSTVNIVTGGLLRVAVSPAPVTNVATILGINTNASLDLGNSNLQTLTSASTIQTYLKNGYNGGAWNGTSAAIVSFSASTSGGTAVRSLGYATGADVTAGRVSGSVSIPAGQTLVKYTTPGDADLSGSSDFNDFLALQNNFNKAGNWSQGDFDYSGTTDFNDFLILQNNYNHTLNANGTVAGGAGGAAKSALAKASTLTASPAVTQPTVTYILSPNDDGHGNFAAGKFAIYAIDSSADGNHGIASYQMDVLGYSLITNFAPKGTYDDGTNTGGTVSEGFGLLRTGNGAFSTATDPVKGSQDTVDASGVKLIYGMGQIAGNLNSQAPAGSSGGTGKVQPSYGATLLMATGTFTGDGSGLVFNNSMAFDKANVFLTGTDGSTEAAAIVLTGVPEPTTLGLVALAAGGLLGRRKRRQ